MTEGIPSEGHLLSGPWPVIREAEGNKGGWSV